jgi:hypothetical protein
MISGGSVMKLEATGASLQYIAGYGGGPTVARGGVSWLGCILTFSSLHKFQFTNQHPNHNHANSATMRRLFN